MIEKQPDRVADEIGGGEIATDEKPLEIGADFAIREAQTFRLQRDHVAHEVVLRRAPALFDVADGSREEPVATTRLDLL